MQKALTQLRSQFRLDQLEPGLEVVKLTCKFLHFSLLHEFLCLSKITAYSYAMPFFSIYVTCWSIRR